MRFPKIDDVAAELRAINKQQLNRDDADEGIDVRLQVYPDGDWAVRSGSSDYDQDHRGYWGASGVPGDNRRFDSKAVARDLIDQAKEQRATGGDDNDDGDGLNEPRVQEEAEEEPDDYIQIPVIAKWRQIGGDMNPGAYGALLARSDGDYIDLWEIQPVREFVGDEEAAEVGFPFWTKEAGYDLEALDPSKPDTKRAIDSMDLGDALAEMSPPQRALAIAEALMRYGHDVGEGPAGWSKDAVPTEDGPVEWWGGVGGPEYLADEDDEFRREVLGEEDDEEEDEDEEEEDDQ
jgi:hypothetical protein